MVRGGGRDVLQLVGGPFCPAGRLASRLRHRRVELGERLPRRTEDRKQSAESGRLEFLKWADLAASLAATGFVLAGLYFFAQSRRVAAFTMFERAVLVSIFFTQVFAFVYSQFAAVFGLFFDLILFVAVRATLSRELEYEDRGERALGGPEPWRVFAALRRND